MIERVVEYATYPVAHKDVAVPVTCDLDGSTRNRKAAIEVATAGVSESTVWHIDRADLWRNDVCSGLLWRVTVLLCTDVSVEHRDPVQRMLEKSAPWTTHVHVFEGFTDVPPLR